MKTILITLFLAYSSLSFSQNRMIVFFKDKPSTFIELSERSLERRKRRGSILNFYDQKIAENYLNEISRKGKVLNKSRWLNAISFETSSSAQEIKETFAFIDRIQEISSVKKPQKPKFSSTEKALDYGVAFNQAKQINVDCLHALGYTGTGVYLGVIDAGFNNMDSVAIFDTLHLENRVLDVYNFVAGNSQVYNSSGHGRAVSACIVGQNPIGLPSYSGTAVDVDIALYVSEDVSSETEIEEFNLVSALERCDSVGVDVVNISLGYFGFDDSLTSHVYADMDGVTTIAAMGVNVAASKGIAVVSSAGNGGPGKISTPCDADSILCVGAVDSLGQYAFFSSVGPSFDNQVKPDVVAQGFGAWTVASNGDLGTANGTSFSSPITAGAVACLLQANPAITVDQLFNAIRQSASQFSSPDTLIGYGIPDFCLANGILNNAVSVSENSIPEFEIHPNPTSGIVIIKHGKLSSNEGKILSSLGQEVMKFSLMTSGEKSEVDLTSLSSGIYFIEIGDSRKKLIVE